MRQLRSSVELTPRRLAVWLFCCAVEFGQYWRLVEVLHLEQVPLARIVIGATFDGNDLLAYTLGALLLYAWLQVRQRRTDHAIDSTTPPQ